MTDTHVPPRSAAVRPAPAARPLQAPGRRMSAALLLFLVVYLAAFGLLFVPKGSFVSGPAASDAGAP